MNTLFTNAHILVATGEVISGCLGVVDKLIAFTGDVPEGFLAHRVIDCDGDLLMPGLVNAHTHLAMTLFRNAADDMELSAWLRERIWPLEDKLTPEDAYWGTMLAAAECIRGGCTCVNDMYFFMDQTARAIADSGLRALLGQGIVTGNDDGKSRLALAQSLFEEYDNAEDGRIRIAITPHAEYTCNSATLAAAGDLAAKLNARLHLHLSETFQEHEECKLRHGLTPAAHFASLGMLHDKTLLAHCVHIDEDDAALIGAAKAHVLHCPQSNLKLGSGIAPVPTMLAHRINVSLGTDGAASNNNLDMFEELRLAATLHKGITGNATDITAKQALSMATVNGAYALGFNAGRLSKGALADIIRIDTKVPNMMPANDLRSAAVYSVSAADVRMTMVNGRILYENGEFYSLDIERIYAEVVRIAERYGLGTLDNS
ncbi:MAG: amidohydrolase [Christensenellales bacterium]|jgi:5-methylthioadenosine/S-adenosylhomocysteine deaminase